MVRQNSQSVKGTTDGKVLSRAGWIQDAERVMVSVMKQTTLGIFSCSAAVRKPEDIQRGIKKLTERGYAVKTADSLYKRSGLFPADAETLAEEFHTLYFDSEVDLMIAARGGYGSSRMLPYLDFGALGRKPKPVCGYSDVTALLCSLVHKAGLVALHGPVLSDIGGRCTERSIDDLLERMSLANSGEPGSFFGREFTDSESTTRVLSPGRASGVLTGGNLSVLTSLLGTDFELDGGHSLLFLEDVNEAPYRVHRMMNQLKMSGVLDRAEGFLLGKFSGCGPDSDDEFSPDIIDIMKEFLSPLEKPVLWNLPVGHEEDNMTLMFGRKLSMTLGDDTLSLGYL